MTHPWSANYSTVLLIGGPDAGKSNYLFRLWIAINNGTGILGKDGLPAKLEYLRAGAECLLEGRFAGRTSKEVNERVFIPVKRIVGGHSGPSGILVLPDVNGEQILSVYRNRQWSQDWEELITQQCGCLLFVRAGSNEIVAPLDWATCLETYGGTLPETSDQEVGAEAQNGTAAVPVDQGGDKMEAPTQVVLTEWLQFLRRAYTARIGSSFRPRIGVVVSAWDAVPGDQQDGLPSEYVFKNFALLHQFLEANTDAFETQYFGLSIVSGDLKDDDDFKTRYAKGKPQEFGQVVHSLSGTRAETPDVTLPAAWALKLDGIS